MVSSWVDLFLLMFLFFILHMLSFHTSHFIFITLMELLFRHFLVVRLSFCMPLYFLFLLYENVISYWIVQTFRDGKPYFIQKNEWKNKNSSIMNIQPHQTLGWLQRKYLIINYKEINESFSGSNTGTRSGIECSHNLHLIPRPSNLKNSFLLFTFINNGAFIENK